MSFFYDEAGVCGLLYNGATCYHYVKNLQGDIVALLDSRGTVVAKYLYDPWGVPTVTNEAGTVITDPEHIGNLNPFRYRGYYYDTETGWYYLQSRYYDPTLRRFLNADVMDVLTVDMMAVADKNLFAYCNGNPVMYSDPSGRAPKWWQWAISGAMVVGGIILIATGAGSTVGGALVCAGVNSIIGSYTSEASGGSSVAGWVGGIATGALSGLGAGWAGSTLHLATQATGTAALKSLAKSVGISFVSGVAGATSGSIATSWINGDSLDLSSIAKSALVGGTLNILAGFSAAAAGAIGGMSKKTATAVTTAKGVETAWSLASEVVMDCVSTFFGMFD